MNPRPAGKSIRPIFAILFLLVSVHARADGVFLPASVGVAGMPNMPSQRAVIVHDGRTETLVVESTMNAQQGSDFTWILPLPAAPTSIEKGSIAALNTLFFCFGPKLLSASDAHLGVGVTLLLLSLCMTGAILAFSTRQREKWYSALTSLLIICALMAISVGEGPGGSVGSSAQVLSRETVGNYDVAVLQGSSADPIASWLAQNGFAPLDPKARSAIDAYAAEKWVFLVAKLHRAGTGAMTPHPLQVRFPSSQPIYPMRLTALAGNPVYLKIAVHAMQPWTCPGLKVEYSSDFHLGEKGSKDLWGSGAWINDHAELHDLLGFDGRLTILDGTLDSGAMAKDIAFESASFGPMRATYCTPRGALAGGLLFTIVILAAGFPIIGIIFKRRRRSIGRLATLGLVMIALACGGRAWLSADTMPGATDIRFHEEQLRAQETWIFKTAREIEFTPQMPVAEISRLVLDKLKAFRNIYTGEPLRLEHSPGNIQFVIANDGAMILTHYDYRCNSHSGPKLRSARN
ncbi:DUF2330 domain-containing protein [bacterium]|nr:DUF2330 domain-containing protein [bacterium]